MNGMLISGQSMAHWAGSVLGFAGLRRADCANEAPRRGGICLTSSPDVGGTIAAEPPSRPISVFMAPPSKPLSFPI